MFTNLNLYTYINLNWCVYIIYIKLNCLKLQFFCIRVSFTSRPPFIHFCLVPLCVYVCVCVQVHACVRVDGGGSFTLTEQPYHIFKRFWSLFIHCSAKIFKLSGKNDSLMHSCLSLTRKSLTYQYIHSLVKSVKWFIAYMEKSICDI